MYLKCGQRTFVVFLVIFLIFLLFFVSIEIQAQNYGEINNSDLADALGTFFAKWIFAGANSIIEFGSYLFFLVIKLVLIDIPLNFGLLDVIQPVWELFRDIVNIGITVLFILTAFRGMFETVQFGKVRLIYLLLAGLLNNFSAFFVFILLDISNAFALLLYNGVGGTGSIVSLFLDALINISDAGAITGEVLFLALLLFPLSFCLVFLFVYFTIILLDRFIRSVILIITSPVLVLGFLLSLSSLGGDKGETVLEKYILKQYEALLLSAKKIFITPIILFVGLHLANIIFVTIYNVTASVSGDFPVLNLAKINEDTIAFTGAVFAATIAYLIVLYKTALFAATAAGNAIDLNFLGIKKSFGASRFADYTSSSISNPFRHYFAERERKKVDGKEKVLSTARILAKSDFISPEQQDEIKDALYSFEHPKKYGEGERDLSEFDASHNLNRISKLTTEHEGKAALKAKELISATRVKKGKDGSEEVVSLLNQKQAGPLLDLLKRKQSGEKGVEGEIAEHLSKIKIEGSQHAEELERIQNDAIAERENRRRIGADDERAADIQAKNKARIIRRAERQIQDTKNYSDNQRANLMFQLRKARAGDESELKKLDDLTTRNLMNRFAARGRGGGENSRGGGPSRGGAGGRNPGGTGRGRNEEGGTSGGGNPRGGGPSRGGAGGEARRQREAGDARSGGNEGTTGENPRGGGTGDGENPGGGNEGGAGRNSGGTGRGRNEGGGTGGENEGGAGGNSGGTGGGGENPDGTDRSGDGNGRQRETGDAEAKENSGGGGAETSTPKREDTPPPARSNRSATRRSSAPRINNEQTTGSSRGATYAPPTVDPKIPGERGSGTRSGAGSRRTPTLDTPPRPDGGTRSGGGQPNPPTPSRPGGQNPDDTSGT